MTFIRHFLLVVPIIRSRPVPIFLEFYLPLILVDLNGRCGYCTQPTAFILVSTCELWVGLLCQYHSVVHTALTGQLSTVLTLFPTVNGQNNFQMLNPASLKNISRAELRCACMYKHIIISYVHIICIHTTTVAYKEFFLCYKTTVGLTKVSIPIKCTAANNSFRPLKVMVVLPLQVFYSSPPVLHVLHAILLCMLHVHNSIM